MIVSFHATIAALADSIIREHCGDAGDDASQVRDAVAQFLLGQHGRMPDYLRLPLMCLTLVFDAWPLLYAGRPFHRLSHKRRWRQIRAWKQSKLGFRRDLVKFFETLTVFGWYSEVCRQDHSLVSIESQSHVF